MRRRGAAPHARVPRAPAGGGRDAVADVLRGGAGPAAPHLALGAALLLPPRRARVLCAEVEDRDGRARGAPGARQRPASPRPGCYEPERRPFRAHATVARLRSGARPPRRPPPAAPSRSRSPGRPLTLLPLAPGRARSALRAARAGRARLKSSTGLARALRAGKLARGWPGYACVWRSALVVALAVVLALPAACRRRSAGAPARRRDRRRSAPRCACRWTARARCPARCRSSSRACTADAARPTLVYLSGGPGGAGIEEMLAVMPLAPALEDRYRVVGFDQRGTGGSGPAALPASSSATRGCAASAPERTCARRLGAGAAALHDAGLGRGPRGDPRRARRRALDAVRHLLRDRAGARLRARAPRPRRAADPRLGRRPRRPRPVRARPASARWGRACRRSARAAAAASARTRSAIAAAGGAAAQRSPARRAVSTRAGGVARADVGPTALADLLFDSDYNPPLRAAVPAAVRAALHGDAAPLAAAGRARATGSRAAAAAVVLERPLRDGVRGDPAAVGRGDAARATGSAEARRRAAALGPAAFCAVRPRDGRRRRDRPLPALARRAAGRVAGARARPIRRCRR